MLDFGRRWRTLSRLRKLLVAVPRFSLIRVAALAATGVWQYLEPNCVSLATADLEWMFPVELSDGKIGDGGLRGQCITYRKEPLQAD